MENEARGLHDADPWPKLITPDGRVLIHPKWNHCNEEHKQRYRNYLIRMADDNTRSV